MKRFLIKLWIIPFLLVLGLSIIACDETEDNSNNNNNDLPAIVDKEDLQSLYEQYKDYDTDEYTDVTALAFLDAIENAKILLENDDVTQEQVDTAIAALNTTIEKLKPNYDESYTPTTFSKNSVKTEIIPLGDGVRLIRTTITRNVDGGISIINKVEVNLNKAEIRAESDSRGPDAYYRHGLSTHLNHWNEDNQRFGKRAMAIINGDYYLIALDSGHTTSNAYVRDSVILRDRSGSESVSALMVFGVKGNTAQIAPIMRYEGDITAPGVRDHVNTGRLFYTDDGKVTSTDGTWYGYTTIMGGAAALITDGQIPKTVAMETNHNAIGVNMPRTVVALKGENTVVLIAVESLRYRSGGNWTDADPRGLSFAQLTDFLMYYGATDAFNLDGGGSTQMLYKDGYNGTGTTRVAARSSDGDGSWSLTGRAVPNTLLAVTK